MALAIACLGPGPLAEAQGLRLHRREPEIAERKPAEKPFPFGVTWVLQAVNDKPVASGDPPSFSIDGSLRGRGFGGCNTFSMALYPIKNQTLAAGAIATTRKTCSPDVMASERAFLVALHGLPKWNATPEGNTLTLTATHATLSFHRGI